MNSKRNYAEECAEQTLIFAIKIGAKFFNINKTLKTVDFFDEDKKMIARVRLNGTEFFN